MSPNECRSSAAANGLFAIPSPEAAPPSSLPPSATAVGGGDGDADVPIDGGGDGEGDGDAAVSTGSCDNIDIKKSRLDVTSTRGISGFSARTVHQWLPMREAHTISTVQDNPNITIGRCMRQVNSHTRRGWHIERYSFRISKISGGIQLTTN
jgi:hypothetical protein